METKGTVNQRIVDLIEKSTFHNQSHFCQELGLNRGTLHNVVKNRSKPSFPILSTIAKHFTNLNCRWLLVGSGKMFLEGGESKHAPTAKESEAIHDNKMTILQNELESYKARLADKEEIIKGLKQIVKSKEDLIDTYDRVLKGKGFLGSDVEG